VKEIHQDVIHEHHKDVIVEHKQDIVHEHHQNIIHEHHQPVVIEKHIHEHHQPIIHEKHTSVVEETHVPIVHETHVDRQDREQRTEVRDEIYEKAVIETTHSKPIVTEVVESTQVISEGSTHVHSHGAGHVHSQGSTHIQSQGSTHVHGNVGVQGNVGLQGQSQGTAGVGGQTYVHETLVQDGQLLEDEEWIVDEHGQKKKAKRGFFGNLKDKITGHHQ
jgi:hypothetical protein